MSITQPSFTKSTLTEPTKELFRACVIGDSHDGPHLPNKERFSWIGKHIKETKPDIVIHIGDLLDLHSLNSHEPNATLKGRMKTTYDEDLDSCQQALQHFHDGMEGYECPIHITLGNHEDRAFRFMDNNPELVDFIDYHLYSLFHEFGWSYSEYGQLFHINGVAFVHVPLNGRCRPFGGEHSENQIANRVLETLVYGHTHRRLCKSFSKVGQRNIQVCNVGSSMPYGHVENYARLASGSGWSYGVMDMDIQWGEIFEHWIDMRQLQERYS